MGEPADWNPYATPASDLDSQDEAWGVRREIPPSVFGKLALAVGLLGANLPLLGGITLTVWLPGNFLANWLWEIVPLERQGLFASPWYALIQSVFGPIEWGALTFAVARRLDGRRVTYREAMAVGLRNWGSLFAAQLAAGLYIALGFLALIVPGIILSVRYALLCPVVVLEQSPRPRARSTELTQGRGGPIFFTMIASGTLDSLYGWASDEAMNGVEALDSLGGSSLLGCLGSIIQTVFVIALVLFYVEATRPPRAAEPNPDPA